MQVSSVNDDSNAKYVIAVRWHLLTCWSKKLFQIFISRCKAKQPQKCVSNSCDSRWHIGNFSKLENLQDEVDSYFVTVRLSQILTCLFSVSPHIHSNHKNNASQAAFTCWLRKLTTTTVVNTVKSKTHTCTKHLIEVLTVIKILQTISKQIGLEPKPSQICFI